jgi:hypothetical protein
MERPTLYTQKEAADYLGIPHTTFVNRLYGVDEPPIRARVVSGEGGLWLASQPQLDEFKERDKSDIPPPDVLSGQEAADLIGISLFPLHYHVERGRIPYTRKSNYLIFWREDVEEFISSREKPAPYSFQEAQEYIKKQLGQPVPQRSLYYHMKAGNLRYIDGEDDPGQRSYGRYFTQEMLDEFIEYYRKRKGL